MLTELRKFPVIAFFLFLFTSAGAAQTTHYVADGDQLPGPDCLLPAKPVTGPPKVCTADDYQSWLNDITHWRAEMRVRAGFSSVDYDRPELKWTQSSFIQPQMMVEDRYFYDPIAGKYTVDRYLDDLEKRYGGIDSVLVWPVYPNIGIDNRNQYDLTRAMPGGVPGVRQMVEDFHRRGVKVFFPVMLWDQGTHDPGMPNWEATAKLLAEVGSRRSERRHAARCSTGFPHRVRRGRPSPGTGTRALHAHAVRRRVLEHYDLGLLAISRCPHDQCAQMA